MLIRAYLQCRMFTFFLCVRFICVCVLDSKCLGEGSLKARRPFRLVFWSYGGLLSIENMPLLFDRQLCEQHPGGKCPTTFNMRGKVECNIARIV